MVVNGSHSVGSLLSLVYPRAQCSDLYFFIYVNDIHDVVLHSNTKLFADDVKLSDRQNLSVSTSVKSYLCFKG